MIKSKGPGHVFIGPPGPSVDNILQRVLVTTLGDSSYKRIYQ